MQWAIPAARCINTPILTDRDPLYQGGFIWDYIDQALLWPNGRGERHLAYGGDFGDRPNDGNFCGNGIVYADTREPSPKMAEVKFNYQNIAVTFTGDHFTVVNKHLFTATDAFDCTVELMKDGQPITQYPVATNVAPLSAADYPLPFARPTEAGEYAVTVIVCPEKATPPGLRVAMKSPSARLCLSPLGLVCSRV